MKGRNYDRSETRSHRGRVRIGRLLRRQGLFGSLRHPKRRSVHKRPVMKMLACLLGSVLGSLLGATSVTASEPDVLYDSLRRSLEQVRDRASDYSAKSRNATAYANLVASDFSFRQFVLILAQTDKVWNDSRYRKADLYGPRNRIPSLIDRAGIALERLNPARCTEDSLYEDTGACFEFLVRRLSLKKTDDPGYRPGIFLSDGVSYQRKFDQNFDIQVREFPMRRDKDSSELAMRFFAALLARGAVLLDEFDDHMVELDHGISLALRQIARSGSAKKQDVEANCFSLLYTNVRDSREGTRYMIDLAVYKTLDGSFRVAEKHCKAAVSKYCGSPTGSAVKADFKALCLKARERGYE